jgi:hypothetical protein
MKTSPPSATLRGGFFMPAIERKNPCSYFLLDVNYLDRSASIILAGGSGE